MKNKLKKIKNILFDWRVILGIGLIGFLCFKADEIINGDTWTFLSWIGFAVAGFFAMILVVMIVGMIFIFLRKVFIKLYIFIRNKLYSWRRN